jgi:hypothetical protein
MFWLAVGVSVQTHGLYICSSYKEETGKSRVAGDISSKVAPFRKDSKGADTNDWTVQGVCEELSRLGADEERREKHQVLLEERGERDYELQGQQPINQPNSSRNAA